jgi:uncharacterized repeat protein (TIGR01451 family)
VADEDEGSGKSSLRHPVVVAALITVIGGLPAAAIANLSQIEGFVNRLYPDSITYTVEYTNTGTAAQSDLRLSAELPAGLDYVEGSTYYRYLDTDDDWTSMGGDWITTGNVVFKTFDAKRSVAVAFTANVTDSAYHTCGPDGVNVKVTSSSKAAMASSIRVSAICR